MFEVSDGCRLSVLYNLGQMGIPIEPRLLAHRKVSEVWWWQRREAGLKEQCYTLTTRALPLGQFLCHGRGSVCVRSTTVPPLEPKG
jgi:hypothetical protein